MWDMCGKLWDIQLHLTVVYFTAKYPEMVKIGQSSTDFSISHTSCIKRSAVLLESRFRYVGSLTLSRRIVRVLFLDLSIWSEEAEIVSLLKKDQNRTSRVIIKTYWVDCSFLCIKNSISNSKYGKKMIFYGYETLKGI